MSTTTRLTEAHRDALISAFDFARRRANVSMDAYGYGDVHTNTIRALVRKGLATEEGGRAPLTAAGIAEAFRLWNERNEDAKADDEGEPVADSSGREFTDWWTVTNRAGDELVRVQGDTMADANRAAREHQIVRETSRREGGHSLRRLYADELDVHMLTPGGNMCGASGPDTSGTGHVTCVDCRELLDEEGRREARGVYLCSVWEIPTDQCECPDCEALHDDQDDDGAEVEGRVIAHQGAGRGTSPEHADDPDARAAVAVLEAAGHAPATIINEDESDAGTGYRCVPRGEGAVYVYHLIDGADRRSAGEWWDIQLDAYARSLRAAGWVTLTPRGRCVQAMRPGTPAGDVYGAKASAPEPLPKRTPGAHSGVQDAIDRHHAR